MLTEGPETAGLTANVNPDSSDGNGIYGDPRKNDELAKCLGVPTTALASTPSDKAESPNFANARQTLFAESQALVYTATEADALADLIVQPNFAACQQQVYGDLIQVKTPPAGALAAFRVAGTSSGGLYVGDVIYVHRGPVLCSLTVTATTGLPDTSLEGRLVSQLLDKLQGV